MENGQKYTQFGDFESLLDAKRKNNLPKRSVSPRHSNLQKTQGVCLTKLKFPHFVCSKVKKMIFFGIIRASIDNLFFLLGQNTPKMAKKGELGCCFLV